MTTDDLLKRADTYLEWTQPIEELLKRAEARLALTFPIDDDVDVDEELIRDLAAALRAERERPHVKRCVHCGSELMAMETARTVEQWKERAERAEADAIEHATAESIARLQRDRLRALLRDNPNAYASELLAVYDAALAEGRE